MVHSSDFNQMEKSCQVFSLWPETCWGSPWMFLCFDLKMFDKHFAVGAKHFTKHSITSWKKSFWAKGWLQILHSFHRTFHQTFHFELISFSFYIWPKLIIWWPKVCIKMVEKQSAAAILRSEASSLVRKETFATKIFRIVRKPLVKLVHFRLIILLSCHPWLCYSSGWFSCTSTKITPQ